MDDLSIWYIYPIGGAEFENMYTQSNAYVKKLGSWTILSLLLLSTVLVVIPIAAHATITGTPTLGALNSVPTPGSFASAGTSINVTAGSATVSAINNAPATGFFTIDFTGVTFSGAQFFLYMSTNGLNNVNRTGGDVAYAGPFSKSDFAANVGTLKAVTFGSNTYYIGEATGTNIPVVEGPIPIAISNAYNYVKVYDGSCGTNPTFCGGAGIAVAAGVVLVQPGLTVSPTSGPAGVTVTASGGGFPTSTTVNLNYTFTFQSFANPSVATVMKGNWTTGVSTGPGYFTTSAAMVDTKQVINPPPLSPLPTTSIAISATHYSGATTRVYASTTFTENNRFISEVVSLDSSGTIITPTENPFVLNNMYGSWNGSSVGPVRNLFTQNAVSLGTLVIAGNDTLVNSGVTFWVGSTATGGTLTQIGSTSSNGQGNYNGTAALPPLSNGLHLVIVQNNGVSYWFQIFILPSLILTPSSGPVHTTVTAQGYGFPAGSNIYLYWFELTTTDDTYFNLNSTSGALINITIPSNGFFTGVMFFVPHSFGGSHDVAASTSYVKNPTSVPATEVAHTSFTVTPQITVTPSSVNANTMGMMMASGTGFNPNNFYLVQIDNSFFTELGPSNNGDLVVNYTAAGFRPGLHQIELVALDESLGYFSDNTGSSVPAAYAYWNVTTTGDYISNQISGFTAAINDLKTTMTNLQNSIASLTTSVQAVQTSVGQIATNVNSILTNTNGLSTTLSTLGGKIDSLNTALTSVSGSLTSISNTVNSINTALGSTGSVGSQLSGMASQVKSTNDTVNAVSTYVLVVAVLAAITLVLELAIIVRKLS